GRLQRGQPRVARSSRRLDAGAARRARHVERSATATPRAMKTRDPLPVKRGRWTAPIGLALVALASTACATAGRAGHIQPDLLLTQIDSGTAPVVVDVRTEWEYNRGHVPGALHIPFYALLAHEDELPLSPAQTVVVYCEHGPRAGIAKLTLRLAGYE